MTKPDNKGTFGSAGTFSAPVIKPKGVFKYGDRLAVVDRDERFEYRWINAQVLEQNGWTHWNGWEPVRTGNDSGEDNANKDGFATVKGFGTFRRAGELILARLPKEEAAKLKAYYRRKAMVRENLVKSKASLQSQNQYRGESVIDVKTEFKDRHGVTKED